MLQTILRKSFCCTMLALSVDAAEPAGTASPTVVDGNSAFALDLYQRLKDQPGNLFFSPHSISTALAMAYAGARNETEAQMARTLHFSLPQEKLHPAFAALDKDLAARKGCELAVANRLWGQKGYAFLDAFLGTTRDCYGAALEPLDFGTDAEGARKTINAWVEKQTRDKISGLLQPGSLGPDTKLVLTNAIYFKGKWDSPFDAGRTGDAPFQTSGDRKIDVRMMRQKGTYRHATAGAIQILELPYQEDALSMVVLLPREATGLADLEAGLTEASLKRWLSGLQSSEVDVSFPRLKLTSTFSLGNTLAGMGMPLAFSNADFSGMTGSRELSLTAVIHQAFVDVNEEGTEAAAATAVELLKCLDHDTPVFRADHPFLFLIRDRKSGAILFMGRVVDPTA